MGDEASRGQGGGHRYHVEINVVDEETKAKIHECIEKRGKLTITSEVKGFALGSDGGYQSID
jgi:hypothetical protein